MRYRLTIAVAFATLAFSAHAEAAPQILGVASADEPLQLQCSGGECVTDVATFCMQPHRPVPGPNTVYKAAGEGFRLIVEHARGLRHSVPAPEVRIVKVRGYTAVTVAIREDQPGGKPVAIALPKRSVLVPEAVAGDADPVRADEVTHALATLRPIADGVFAEHIESLQATTIVNRLVNATPLQGRMAATDRNGLWERTMGNDPAASSPAGERARDILGYCGERTGAGAFFSIRRCLENRLDGMIMDINSKYWKALQPGS